MRRVLLALGPLLVSYASSSMVFVRYKDFTPRERNKCVELDARMNPTLSLSHYNECPLLLNFFLSQSVGVIDLFVYAHNNHRRNMDNVGTNGDC